MNYRNSPPCCSRRDFLSRTGLGMGALGLLPLLSQNGLLASDSPLHARAAHFPAKAKRVIHIFPQPSHSLRETRS